MLPYCSLRNQHWPDAIGQLISYRASEQGHTTGPTGMWKFCGHSVVSIIWASKTWFGPVDQCLPLVQMASEINSFWHRLHDTQLTTWSSLVQVMACCLMVPSSNLNGWWLIQSSMRPTKQLSMYKGLMSLIFSQCIKDYSLVRPTFCNLA